MFISKNKVVCLVLALLLTILRFFTTDFSGEPGIIVLVGGTLFFLWNYMLILCMSFLLRAYPEALSNIGEKSPIQEKGGI